MTESESGVPKVETGLPGLDVVLKGGIPRNRTTLIVGSAGSGKTVIACEFIYRGATELGEPAVFVTFEESRERICKNVESFGWDLAKLEAEGKICFVEFAQNILSSDTIVGEFDFTIMVERVRHAVERIGAKRVVIDSLSAFFDQVGDSRSTRKVLLNIAEQLAALDVTSLITAERYAEYGSLEQFHKEVFVSDCVIVLRHILDEERVRRTAQVLKYRGSDHRQGEFPFTITPKGIVVMPLVDLELTARSSTARISSGNAEIDAMTGGGFFRDSIILVSGPTGTGKTLLTSTFLESSCQSGERAILFAFEESRDQLIRNGHGWGVDLERWEKEGLLRIECSYPESTGPEDQLLRMKTAVEQFKPQRVGCDSLSAMERILSVRSFREFVTSFASFLKQKQVAGLFTNTSATLLGGESITETHISTLTDSILLLRYVETGGAMRRAITVIKMRGSWHDKDIREFEVSDHGMVVGEPFRNIENIMSGAARSVVQSERVAMEKIRRR